MKILVTKRHSQPGGVLAGFADEADRFDYRLEHDPRFHARMAHASESIQAGRGVRLEDLTFDDDNGGTICREAAEARAAKK